MKQKAPIQKKKHPFYQTAAWKRARRARLMRDNYMCVDCLHRFYLHGGYKPRRATMVHHIIPVSQRPDLALDINNLRSLCDQCHNKRHPEKGGHGARQPKAAAAGIRVIKISGDN